MKKLTFFLILQSCLLGNQVTSYQLLSQDTEESKATIFASFLYWQANEQITSSWANNFLPTDPDIVEEGYFNPETVYFDWNPGFRVGASHILSNNCFEIKGYWTHYQTSSHQKSSIKQLGTILIPQFFEGFLSSHLGLEGQVNWNLNYNFFDLELSRSFLATRYLSFKPFVGLKGGYIKQNVHVKMLNLYPDPFSVSHETVTNNFYGIGPSVGIDMIINCLQNCNTQLNIDGDIALATQWGNWSSSDIYYNSLSPVSSSISGIGNNPFGSVSFYSKLGFSWQYLLTKQSRLTLQAGWELQYFVNQLRMPTFQLLRLHGDLVLQGLTVNCKFDY